MAEGLASTNVRDFCNNLTQSLSKELVTTTTTPEHNQLSCLLDRPDFQALLRLHKLVSAHRTKNVRAVDTDGAALLSECVRAITLDDDDEEEDDEETPPAPAKASTSTGGGSKDTKEELRRLLADSDHLQSLLDAHDRVARKEFWPACVLPDVPYEVDEDDGCAVKIVRLVKNNQPLGATIKRSEGSSDLVIARIMHGGVADRSGCVQVGDRVVEVNGTCVVGKQPSDVVKLLSGAGSNGTVVFKLVPAPSGSLSSAGDASSPEGRVRVRAHFQYDPAADPLNPCPEAGVVFERGDVLLVVDSTDPFWWQARLEADPLGRVGLIPSKQLQEKRIAHQQQHSPGAGSDKSSSMSGSGGGAGRKIRRVMYETRSADDYDRDEVRTYEEVARLYPRGDLRRPVVLIGPPGVGRNELKRRLILLAPDRFGTTVPHTSRPARPGETAGLEYQFASRPVMEQWAREGRFIEFGEYKGNLYGTTLDSVRAVASSGRTCVLSPHPQALRVLYSPETKPFVVFVRPPPTLAALKATRRQHRARSTFDPAYGRGFTDRELLVMLDSAAKLDSAYGAYFHVVLVNEHLDTAFAQLLDALAKLETQPQWVPSNWVR